MLATSSLPVLRAIGVTVALGVIGNFILGSRFLSVYCWPSIFNWRNFFGGFNYNIFVRWQC